MEQRKFTVIIPTRERSDTLRDCLKTVVAEDYENLEIIVSDNHSKDDTEDVVYALRDPRIKYINTGRRVSMSENWEYALSNVSSGWVTVLGDDDGLIPGALESVNSIVDETCTRMVRSNGGIYLWPSSSLSDRALLRFCTKQGYKEIRSREIERKVLCGIHPYINLPMLYNGGFVDIAVINEIKRKSGKVFQSMTPDVYSGFAISRVVETYILAYKPLALNGTSRHSNGTSNLGNNQDRGDSPRQLFNKEISIPVHSHIPCMSDGSPWNSIYSCILEAYFQVADSFDFNICPSEMRRFAASASVVDDQLNGEWLDKFCIFNNVNQHQLSFLLTKLRLGLLFYTNKLMRISHGFAWISIPSTNEIRLENVYSAASYYTSTIPTKFGYKYRIVNILGRIAKRLRFRRVASRESMLS